MLGFHSISEAPISSLRITITGTLYYQNVSAPLVTTATLNSVKTYMRLMSNRENPYGVSLGLHMDGASNGTYFPDVTGKTVTVNGTAVTSTAQAKFGATSAYFNGSVTTNWLSVAASNDFLFAGDFTIEAWVRFSTNTGLSSTRNIFGVSVSGTEYFLFAWNRSGGNWGIWLNTTTNSSLGGGTPAIDTWYHVALVRSGTGSNNIKLYIDGTATGTAVTSNATIGYNNQTMYIGNWGNGGHFDGYIDDLIVYKGYAKYTADFTKPTVPFTVTGLGNRTEPALLAGRFNSRTLTADNSDTVLGFHFEGANNGTTFTEVTGKTVTPTGTPVTSSANRRIGSTSLYANGTSYLSVPASADLAFSGDFTIELWVNYSAVDSGLLVGQTWFNAGWVYVGLQYYSSTWEFYAGTLGSFRYNGTPTVGTWYHLAIVRKGTGTGNLKLYVNGVKHATEHTATGTVGSSAYPWHIGGGPDSSDFTGYIDELRMSNVALYSADFTPANDPFSDSLTGVPLVGAMPRVAKHTLTESVAASAALLWSNVTFITAAAAAASVATIRRAMSKLVRTPRYTVLGLHMDGADNGTSFPDVAGKTITRGSTTVTKTAVKQFGTASCYLDGSSTAYLTTGSSSDFVFTGDFTIEGWMNWTSEDTTVDALFSVKNPSGSQYFYVGRYGNTNKLTIALNAGSLTDFATVFNPTFGTWYHIAFVRSGTGSNNITAYVDGASYGTVTYAGTLGYTNAAFVGASSAGLNTMVGYIDDLVVYNGYAKYTAPFSVPTAPFEVINPAYGGLVGAVLQTSRTFAKVISAAITTVGSLIASYIPATGGTTYQNITDTVTATASMARQAGKLVTDSVVSAATLLKQITKSLADSAPIAATVLASKTILQSLADSATTVAALAKLAEKQLAGVVVTTGTIVKQAGKRIIDSSATVATIATIKSLFLALADTVVVTASVAAIRTFLRVVSYAVASSATLTKQIGTRVVYAVSTLASVVKTTPRTIADAIATVATVVAQSAIFKVLAATGYTTATVAKRTYKYVAGSAAAVGTIARVSAIYTSLTATVTTVPVLLRAVVAALQDIVNAVPTIVPTFSITRTISAAATTAATVSKRTVLVITESVAFTATIEALRVFLRTVSSTLATAAALTPTFVLTQVVTATVSTAASMLKSIAAALVSTSTIVATQAALVTKIIASQIATVADLAAGIAADTYSQVVAAAATASASMAKTIYSVVSATTTAVSSVLRSVQVAISTVVSVVASVAAFFGQTVLLTAVSAIASTLTTGIARVAELLASVATTAYIDRLLTKTLDATVALPATITKAVSKSYTATITLVGKLKYNIARIAGFIVSRSIFVGRDETTAEEPIVAAKVVSVEPDQTVVFVDPDDDAVSKTQNRNVAK